MSEQPRKSRTENIQPLCYWIFGWKKSYPDHSPIPVSLGSWQNFMEDFKFSSQFTVLNYHEHRKFSKRSWKWTSDFLWQLCWSNETKLCIHQFAEWYQVKRFYKQKVRKRSQNSWKSRRSAGKRVESVWFCQLSWCGIFSLCLRLSADTNSVGTNETWSSWDYYSLWNLLVFLRTPVRSQLPRNLMLKSPLLLKNLKYPICSNISLLELYERCR